MTKLDLIKNLPTPSEMAQLIPTLRDLNRKILELEKKVLRLEMEKRQRPKKTGIFKNFL